MRYGVYRFESVLESDALLPPYKGSTFRGVLGVALKQVVCTLRNQTCTQCLLRERCVYPLLYEDPASSGRGPSPPHPFFIDPPPSRETSLPGGTPFDFGLVLFGPANDSLPYFVYAFERMGRIGIGRRVEGRRATFSLQQVRSAGKVIYRAEDRRLEADGVEELLLEPPRSGDAEVEEVTLHLETPLRLKFRNRLQAELPFHVLVRALLRRISSLNSRYGDGEPDLDYRGLVRRAEKVRMVESSLRWVDWRRYSNRQERGMLMGGMVGSVRYQGPVGEFLRLIRYGEKVRVGKATTFGLGRIRMETDVP